MNKHKRIDDVKNMQMVLIPIMMKEWKLTGDEMADYLAKYDLLNIIDDGYEIFNSTGIPGILDELEEYIINQGGKLKVRHKRHRKNSIIKGMNFGNQNMVDLLNIKWNGRYAEADLTEDGSTDIAYTITVDCKTGKILKNTNGEMTPYIDKARDLLVELYREKLKPKTVRTMWY